MEMKENPNNCSQHAYTAIAGYGLKLIPNSLCEAWIDSGTLEITLVTGESARITPGIGGYRSSVNQSAKSLCNVVDVEAGCPEQCWQIETGIFKFIWPIELTLFTQEYPGSSCPFCLSSKNGGMVYMQNPQKSRKIDELRLPEQQVIELVDNADLQTILVEYQHENESWRIRHIRLPHIYPNFVVTLQARSENMGQLEKSAAIITSSIEKRMNWKSV